MQKCLPIKDESCLDSDCLCKDIAAWGAMLSALFPVFFVPLPLLYSQGEHDLLLDEGFTPRTHACPTAAGFAQSH